MNTFSFGALTTSVIMFLLSYSSVTNAQVDTGNGYIYKLEATQDVYIHDSSNYNFYDFLIVAKHPGYPKKRKLLQFQDLPSTCKQIKWAKMYIYYWYSHKPSSMTEQQVPSIARTLQVHQIMKQWSETQATSINRQSGIPWTSPFLALDGSDAASDIQDNVILRPNQPGRVYIEFNITEASLNWKSGEPNYGVLVWATNENEKGRDIRFYSRERATAKPYVNVLCDYNEDINNSYTTVIHSLLATPTATTLPGIFRDGANALNAGAITGITIGAISIFMAIIVIFIISVICVHIKRSVLNSGESSPVIKVLFSVKNEAYGITTRQGHQSSIEVTENVTYNIMKQHQSLQTPPVYETLNKDINKTTGVYDNPNEYI